MIEITGGQIDRVTKLLSNVPDGAKNALTEAIQRGRDTVRKTALTGITTVYAISKQNVRAETNITLRTNRTDNEIIGTVLFAGAAIPLYRFHVTPRGPTATSGGPIRVGVYAGRQKTLEHAFVAQMKSLHWGVFERIPGEFMRTRTGESKHSQRIGYVGKSGIYDQFYGPSTAKMAQNSVVLEEVETTAKEAIDQQVERSLDRILQQFR